MVGGLPINTAGVTIERYNIESDGWTLLGVNLPKGLFRHTIFLASQNRIAILGGQGSFDVYILYIQDTMWYDKNKKSARDGNHDTFKISVCDKKLPEIVESTFPIMHLRETNEILIINTANQSKNLVTPKIFTYSADMLDFSRKMDTVNQNSLANTRRN
jgi:N-acetylneuraminic acid mutarotase